MILVIAVMGFFSSLQVQERPPPHFLLVSNGGMQSKTKDENVPNVGSLNSPSHSVRLGSSLNLFLPIQSQTVSRVVSIVTTSYMQSRLKLGRTAMEGYKLCNTVFTTPTATGQEDTVIDRSRSTRMATLSSFSSAKHHQQVQPILS